MRGEVCIGVATFFCFTSVIIAIFGHVAQINSSSVPRQLYMASVNVSAYGVALRAATGKNAPGLYTDNATLPMGEQSGLRQLYAWGIYSHCAYVNADSTKAGSLCTNQTFAHEFRPMDVVLGDTPEDYYPQTKILVPDATAFKNSGYLASLTRPAGYFLLIGTIAAFVALLSGLIKRKITFILASSMSLLGSIFLLIGVSLWTAAVNQAETVNRAVVRGNVSLGMTVTTGSALWIFWAAFVCLAIATYPYTVSAVTFLKKHRLR